MTCGIYSLNFSGTPKMYIGQSKNIEVRFNRHCSELKNQIHSKKLNEAYLKYGLPELEILEVCLLEELNSLEMFHIETWNSVADGFNTFGDQTFTRSIQVEPTNRNKYSKSQILEVFDLLIDSKIYRFKEISEITGVHTNTIRSISSGTCYKWLINIYPDKYEKLISMIGTRETGVMHGCSKYSKEQLISVLDFLVYSPGMSYSKIAELTKVSPATVSFVSNGTTHLWMKEEFPDKYLILDSLKGTRSGGTIKSRSIVYNDVISPEGARFSITNIREFGRIHNIPHTSLHNLLTKKGRHARGWVLAE